MNVNAQFYVLLGDLVSSRRIQNRRAFEQVIDHSLQKLTQQYSNELQWVAPLQRVLGIDQMAGVMVHPRSAFDITVSLNLDLWPQKFRFALARGTIDIGLDKKKASAMDGPVFHRAADSLQRARHAKVGFAVDLPDQPPITCQLVEKLVELHNLLVTSWTKREVEVVRAYRDLGSQLTVAQHLTISQQAVSSSLQRAHFHQIATTEIVVREWLAGLHHHD